MSPANRMLPNNSFFMVCPPFTLRCAIGNNANEICLCLVEKSTIVHHREFWWKGDFGFNGRGQCVLWVDGSLFQWDVPYRSNTPIIYRYRSTAWFFQATARLYRSL